MPKITHYIQKAYRLLNSTQQILLFTLCSTTSQAAQTADDGASTGPTKAPPAKILPQAPIMLLHANFWSACCGKPSLSLSDPSSRKDVTVLPNNYTKRATLRYIKTDDVSPKAYILQHNSFDALDSLEKSLKKRGYYCVRFAIIPRESSFVDFLTKDTLQDAHFFEKCTSFLKTVQNYPCVTFDILTQADYSQVATHLLTHNSVLHTVKHHGAIPHLLKVFEQNAPKV